MDNKCGLKSQEQGLQSLSDHGTLQGLKSLFLNDMVMDNTLSGIQDLCQHFWRSYFKCWYVPEKPQALPRRLSENIR